MTIYDIMIIGSGPAGMTAAIYAARAGYSVVVLDREGPGGQIAKSPKVENFPGIKTISGSDLAFNMFQQMEELHVQFFFEETKEIYKEDNLFTAKNETNSFHAKAVIIATGAAPIDLNVPGGTDYIGDGLYYCAVCDGPFFKNKRVIVIGGGNSGAQYALELAKYCEDVKICEISNELVCETMLREEIENTKNITKILSAKTASIFKHPTNGIMIVKLEDGRELKADGIFVAIGQKPATDFVKGLIDLDERGYIISSDLTTNIPGIFVAGDCRTKRIRQAVAAAGDGAEAALLAIKYLKEEVKKGGE